MPATGSAVKMAQVDGVFQLDAVADDLVHESFECDTRDHEDHTFCGVSVQRARPTRNYFAARATRSHLLLTPPTLRR